MREAPRRLQRQEDGRTPCVFWARAAGHLRGKRLQSVPLPKTPHSCRRPRSGPPKSRDMPDHPAGCAAPVRKDSLTGGVHGADRAQLPVKIRRISINTMRAHVDFLIPLFCATTQGGSAGRPERRAWNSSKMKNTGSGKDSRDVQQHGLGFSL